MSPIRALFAAPLLLAACGPNIPALYDKAKEEALAAAGSAPEAWQPDIALALSGTSLSAALQAALDAALAADSAAVRIKLPLGQSAELRPRFTTRSVRVRPSQECPACLGFDAQLVGPVEWALGPARGSAPVDLAVAGVVGLDIKEGKRIELTPRRVTSVKVESSRGGLQFDLDGAVQDIVRDAIRDHVPPIRVAELNLEAIPLRDLRLRTGGEGVVIEVLSNVPGAKPIPRVEAPKEGLTMVLSETAAAGLMRRAAFEAGELAMDVAADPQAIDVAGSDFTLSLRLWRLSGRGWWRDYRVAGTLLVENRKIKLKATKATEVAQSPGAILVDPLAALFEGKILEAVVNAIHKSLPAHRRTDLDIIALDAEAWSIQGRDDALFVGGELSVGAPSGR